jgi:3-hydroxyacyl-[acyl-carrier-protein] dehydratase
MLSGFFFDIQSFTIEHTDEIQQKAIALLLLNESHPIYLGHFPGNPVVPGVCQIQMLKELVEKTLNYQVNLIESDNIKFLKMINPQVNPLLECNLLLSKNSDQQFIVNATIASGPVIFLKFKGKFEIAG